MKNQKTTDISMDSIRQTTTQMNEIEPCDWDDINIPQDDEI